jgi:hypothetical protein
MARAPEHQRRTVDELDWRAFDADMIARIKATIILADLLPELGAAPARERGKWSCPVCGSSDGLQLYERDNRARCYASCSKPLDALDLIGASYGGDFAAAIRAGAQLARIDYEGERAAFLGRDTWTPRPALPLPAARPMRRGLYEWEERAALYEFDMGMSRADAEGRASDTMKARARELLLWIAERTRGLDEWAAGWLENERGLDAEMCAAFGVASCTAPRWRELVNAAAGQFGADVAMMAGVMRAEDGDHHRAGDPFPRVSRFLILPNFTVDGAAVDALRFRDPNPPAPQRKALALLNPSSLVPGMSWALERPYLETFALEMARLTALPLYVCEGELDALSFWQAGRPALAAPGANTWRAGWCASWAGLSRVFVVADQDKGAGVQLATKIGASALQELGEVARVMMRGAIPPAALGFKDANDLLRAGLLPDFIDQCEGC